MSTAYVFTYGTLRPSLATGLPARLIAGLEDAGPATVRGKLLDLGEYPGLVVGDDVVRGDLLRVEDGSRLSAIDDYEGCGGPEPLYRRESWWATTADGARVEAWVYVYARPVGSARTIVSGDFSGYSPKRRLPTASDAG